jgi:hypothetical protein
MPANTAGESNRGQHIQSTAPSDDTSAAERQSDRKAWSEMGAYPAASRSTRSPRGSAG